MKKEEEKKIPHMCESKGHRPLWGRCPKGMRRRAKGEGVGMKAQKGEKMKEEEKIPQCVKA